MNYKYKISIAIVIICSLFLLFASLACNRNGTIKQSELTKAYNEWDKCKNKEISSGFQIKWIIQIQSVSSFGGFYARGHIYGNEHCGVHIIWNSEDKSSKLEISGKDVLVLQGIFEGVSEHGDVIIKSIHIQKIKE